MSKWERFVKETKKKKFWNNFIQSIDDIYNAIKKLGYKETGEYYGQGEQTIHFKKDGYVLTIHFSEGEDIEE